MAAAGLRLPQQRYDGQSLVRGERNQREDLLLPPEESLGRCVAAKDGTKHGHARQDAGHHSLRDSNRHILSGFSSNASSCVAQRFLDGGGEPGMRSGASAPGTAYGKVRCSTHPGYNMYISPAGTQTCAVGLTGW